MRTLVARPRLRHRRARPQHRPHRGGHRSRRGGARGGQPARDRGRLAPRAAAPRAPRRAPPASATSTTSCGAGRSSWSTSPPAASPTSGTGRTACTPRSRPRRACGSPPRAGSSARSRCSTSSRLYPRLAGMTATAHTAAEELEAFYGLRTVVVPTHRPMVRVDEPDVVFTHPEAKRAALVAEIARVHAAGRPVLVGTASVGESEELAAALAAAGVRCEVLNARNDEREAAIVAAGGRAGGGDHLDEHGRARHRHPPRRSGRVAPGRGGGARRPLRDRHEPSREPAHRPPAARARRPAGRPRVVALLRQPRGPAHPALRRRAARLRAAPAAPGRRRRSRAGCSAPRSRAPSGSSRTRASSCGARSSATPRSSRSSGGPSSAGGRRCWSGSEAQHLLAERAAERHERLRPLVGRGGPRRGRATPDAPRHRPLLERPPRRAARDARGQRAPRLRRPLPARRVPPPGGRELPGARGPDRGRGRAGLRADRDHARGRRLGEGGPARPFRHLDLPRGREPLRRERPAEPRGPHRQRGRRGLGAPWLVLLQGLGVLWERRSRRKG